MAIRTLPDIHTEVCVWKFIQSEQGLMWQASWDGCLYMLAVKNGMPTLYAVKESGNPEYHGTPTGELPPPAEVLFQDHVCGSWSIRDDGPSGSKIVWWELETKRGHEGEYAAIMAKLFPGEPRVSWGMGKTKHPVDRS